MTEKYHVEGWVQITISVNHLIDAESLEDAKHKSLAELDHILKAYPNVNLQDYDLDCALLDDE